VRLSGAVTYAFPDGTRLAPGARLVVAANLADFQARYPSAAGPVFGPFTGSLNNAGEEIVVTSATEGVLRGFFYRPTAPWPTATAGTGPSLVLAQPALNPDPARPASWVASSQPGGSPGVGENGLGGFTGPDPDADADADGLTAFLEFALGTSDTNPASGLSAVTAGLQSFGPEGAAADYLTLTFAKPAGSQLAYTVELSPSLTLWHSGPKAAVLVSETPGPENTVRQTWRATTPHSPSSPEYIRLRVWIP